MTAAPTTTPGVVATRTEVVSVTRLSPHFMRVRLTAPALADLGMPGGGPLLDQRIKLVFPSPGHRLPQIPADQTWYPVWSAMPEDERGVMRTYTIRHFDPAAQVGDDVLPVVDIDFVLHVDAQGHSGPASAWAAAAAPGDEVLFIGPHRAQFWGGIEFDPAERRRLLMVGDETALPAVSAILPALCPEITGHVFLEVPTADDVLALPSHAGLEITWLPRDAVPGAGFGDVVEQAVRDHLGLPAAVVEVDAEPDEADVTGPDDELVWETPTRYPGDEEPAPAEPRTADPVFDPGTYAWIAGESRMVTRLRRHLVRELGADREQVAFMGYWREGVAMRG